MSQSNLDLARARERARLSQGDAGRALGVSRAMISYWESGSREPNDRQRAALLRLYNVDPGAIDDGGAEPTATGDAVARAWLRSAAETADAGSQPGLEEFVHFLDRFAELSELTGERIHGLSQSPFVSRARYTQKDDARRKAEEVRNHLGLGIGPILDLDPVADMLGITVYRAPLGGDLTKVPSGAFLHHTDVGFAVLVNLGMTPGRRRFTLAHEIAHALFHSNDQRSTISIGKSPQESFADEFAGEFLMPSEGVRRFQEEAGLPPRVTDAVDAIHIQRYFRTSWPTTLVRLRQMKTITSDTYKHLRGERPLALARSLGYSIAAEEFQQDAELWRIGRFPRAFLRMLRRAVVDGVMTPPTAASFAGLSLPDVTQILGQPGPSDQPESVDREFAEFEDSGVVQ